MAQRDGVLPQLLAGWHGALVRVAVVAPEELGVCAAAESAEMLFAARRAGHGAVHALAAPGSTAGLEVWSCHVSCESLGSGARGQGDREMCRSEPVSMHNGVILIKYTHASRIFHALYSPG